MNELPNQVLLNATKYVTFWKRYVDNTICFVKIGVIEFIISVLNSLTKKFNLYIYNTLPYHL